MHRRLLISASCAVVALLTACATPERSADAVLQQADRAMGVSQLKTLRYAGNGTGSTFGQAYRPADAWPRIAISSYSRQIDYEGAAMREESARGRAEPTGGGALPLIGTGEQRVTALLRGTDAWNLAGTAPAAAPVALDGRIHDLWTTPHGVIRAAVRNKATLRSVGGVDVVAFTEPGRFTAQVRINGNGLVERIDSVQPNPVMGDVPTTTWYSDYRSFGGTQFPTRIRQQMGGSDVLDLRITDVQPNVAVAIETPAPVSGFAERASVEKVAEGVWHLAGGSHNSVLVEMADHLILVESPLYDGRAKAVLAQARSLVPGKPIRYVINSHHHFDHAGGLRAAAAEGVTLVVSEAARPWYERAFANPNSVRPDALRQSGRTASWIGVAGKRTFSDATRTVEVLFIDDSVHAQGFMMVWLPRERLLVEADAYTPGAPNSPAPTPLNGNNVNLVDNIERQRLNVDKILPLHGRVVPVAELYTATGRRAP